MLREISKSGRRLRDSCVRVGDACMRVGARVRSKTLKAFRHRVIGIESVPLAAKIHSNVQRLFTVFRSAGHLSRKLYRKRKFYPHGADIRLAPAS